MAPDASDALAVRELVKAFLNAACTGNLDLLKTLAQQLDVGKGLADTVEDVKDANKRGALHFASREGQIEVCKYLIEELAIDVNVKDEDGDTPLIHAARQGHSATAKYLIEHGADPSIPSELNTTALHHSAGMGDIELLKFLLAKSVAVNMESDAGTPLIWAAGHAQTDAVKLLLEHNADPNLKTEDDISPILTAVAADSPTCVDLLIKAGSDVNVTAGGATPLIIAAECGNLEILKSLLQAGADPNAIGEEGLTPVQVAAARDNRKAVEILFPVSKQVPDVREWSIDGVIKHMNKEESFTSQGGSMEVDKPKEILPPKKDTPEVTEIAKERSAEAKARGDEAYRRNDFHTAIDAYTQAIHFVPSEGTLYSNRSLCWLRIGQAEQALDDARACKALRPDWPKSCYREGAALRLLQKFEEAANAFYDGVMLDPENLELVNAFREAVEAGKEFHNQQQQKSSFSSSCVL